ncbi:MAG: lamin tail domain-containing protein [Polyangiaceae bacterium]|nr:lamin tail domain-containing protein [Polyangiaceae bacterium]MCW5790772.1 lamin tail domain-containing protein [Polyangiaceae bacterium]
MKILPGLRPLRAAGWCAACVFTLSSCAPPEPPTPPEPPGSAQLELRIHGAPSELGVSRVIRIEVLGEGLDAGEWLLIEGALSAYHERRLRERSLPDSLLSRVVPSRSWAEEGAVWLAPQRALAAGQRYSVGVLGLGLVQELDVSPAPPELLAAAWPPPGVVGHEQVYCPAGVGLGSGPEALGGALAPGAVPFEVLPGVGDTGLLAGACFTLRAAPREEPSLAPLEIAGHWLEVSELAAALERPTPEPPACPAPLVALGPSCTEVFDRFARVSRVGPPSLWLLERGGEEPELVRPGARWILRGLTPGEALHLGLTALSVGGVAQRYSARIQAAAPLGLPIISEVLANPSGPERAQEWVELLNIGAAEVELEGYTLEDGGGAVVLPAARLLPGEYALLVTEAYDASYPFDVPPAPGTQLIRLPELGKGGLSNAGEPLLLRDPSGRAVSGVPPLKSSKDGQSWVRREPELPDERESFVEHPAPGASPGGPTPSL